jgi:hypothetical protein
MGALLHDSASLVGRGGWRRLDLDHILHESVRRRFRSPEAVHHLPDLGESGRHRCMVHSSANSVSQYLSELPAERRAAIEAVRAVILKNLPEGYEESMQFGMIGYSIPLSRYPKTYNGKPLNYVALANQKNHMSVYLMGCYGEEKLARWFEAEFRKSGKKLDTGKSCVRFRKLDDLPLPVIGKAVAAMPVDEFISLYERSRGPGRRK